MPLRPDMELQDFKDLFLRKKWLIIFSFLFILLGASIYCVVTPEKYISSTTILVIPQRVPEGYVRKTVTTGLDRLSTIQQQVMSRTRLVVVMEELDLFREERRKLPVEDVVEGMRKRIQLKVKGNDAFTLSFTHENPRVAMMTASRLASFFIDENLKEREQQALGTSEFLESQLDQTKARLEEKENMLGQYKIRHMGELPEQIETNLQLLSQMQTREKANQEAIRYAEDRKEMTEFQLRALEENRSLPVYDTGPRTPAGTVEPAVDPYRVGLSKTLMDKKEELALLKQKYTDSHPAVKRLKDEIAVLEGRTDRVAKDSADAGPARKGGKAKAEDNVSPGPSLYERQVENIREKLKGLTIEIAALKREREEILRSLSVYQAKVENVPRREQELVALTRDYDNLKRSYDDLLKKKLDAEIASNLEKRQKGEQFQILDPANVPSRPFVPNRPMAFGVAFGLAFLIGFGGSIVLEMVNQSVRSVKEFRHFFTDVPVLATIPAIRDVSYQRKMRIRQLAVLGGLVSFTVILMVFLAVYGHKVRTVLQEII